MADKRLKIWETLFQRALNLIDAVEAQGTRIDNWSFGGGTVLMRRHRHRFSKDVDIFLDDPQYLGYLTPRLSQAAEVLTADYVEEATFVKLVFPEGEIDFVVSGYLTAAPVVTESVLGRPVNVETPAEIIAKKFWHRGHICRARDIFDLAAVSELEPGALKTIAPVLRDRRESVLTHINLNRKALEEDFKTLEMLDYRRTFDQCLALAHEAFRQAGEDGAAQP